MSVAKVLKLAEHRDRRSYRKALATTMHGTDRSRAALLEHLAHVAELSGSDRVAVVWIDEYGPGLVHPHVVLDLLSDRPRRIFSVEPLQKAWDLGIPGALDDARGEPATFAVALGSDGARGWFVVADSVTRRKGIDADGRDRLMFLAGECSAVVLHRDLEEDGDEEGGRAFAGWHFLKDLEGHESDEERAEVVGRRFEVGRLLRGLLDEDLVMGRERRVELAARAREALSPDPGDRTAEEEAFSRLLDAYEAGELDAIADAAFEAGEAAERVDHVHGAVELLGGAYEVGVALGDPDRSVRAARALGRILRREALWEEADRWYGVALAIAERAEIWEMIARTRAGLALIHKERGEYEPARERFASALEAAATAADPDATASIHHDLMTLEYVAHRLPEAARHGWRAVNTYRSEPGRTRCLVSFATILRELGDVDAAEDAYLVASRTTDELYYRIYAHDGLAYLAALRGDADAFEARCAECDALGWEDGPRSAKAEILYYRGLGYRRLGRRDEARSWLERARGFAEAHGFTRVLEDAESALRELGLEEEEPSTADHAVVPAPPEIREGLRAMRDEVMGMGA